MDAVILLHLLLPFLRGMNIHNNQAMFEGKFRAPFGFLYGIEIHHD